MSDTEPPDTLRENDKPEGPHIDIGAVVVRNIVREEVQPIEGIVRKSANDVLAAIQGVHEQLAWLVSSVKENRTDIDKNTENIRRIMDHLSIDQAMQ